VERLSGEMRGTSESLVNIVGVDKKYYKPELTTVKDQSTVIMRVVFEPKESNSNDHVTVPLSDNEYGTIQISDSNKTEGQQATSESASSQSYNVNNAKSKSSLKTRYGCMVKKPAYLIDSI
jgi:hypothetical protein